VRANLSRTALAYHVDRAEQTVWMWESGRSVPRTDLLLKIAQALGCSVDELFAAPTQHAPVPKERTGAREAHTSDEQSTRGRS